MFGLVSQRGKKKELNLPIALSWSCESLSAGVEEGVAWEGQSLPPAWGRNMDKLQCMQLPGGKGSACLLVDLQLLCKHG